jgi:mannose-6-phosphate isomerase-like protein (cupin superfamily)
MLPFAILVVAISKAFVRNAVAQNNDLNHTSRFNYKEITMKTIHLTKAGQGKHFLFGTDVTTVRASSSDTSGKMLMLEVTVPAGGGPPVLHRHEYTEIFYFFEGEFEVKTADEAFVVSTLQLNPGDTLSVPSKAWHTFKNVGSIPGRFLVIHSPPVMEGVLGQLGLPIEDPQNLPTLAGPPSPEAMEQLLQTLSKYMEFLPPEKVSSKEPVAAK